MKQIVFILSLILLAFVATGCNPVPSNVEGVLQRNYGRNGIKDFEKVTGTQGVLTAGQELFFVPSYEQKADPSQMTVITNDGGAFTVDPSYAYQLIANEGKYVLFENRHLDPNDLEKFMDNIENAQLNPLVLGVYRDLARTYTSDSLMRHQANYEESVEKELTGLFKSKHFQLLPRTLTGNCKPPQSLINAIEATQVQAQRNAQVKQRLEAAKAELEIAALEAQKSKIEGAGLTPQILMARYIEMLRTTDNKVIITDGKTPVFLQ